MVGNCRLLLGPMFSKKTRRLCEELGTLTDVGMKCILINHIDHARETTYGDKWISTHNSHYTPLSKSITVTLSSSLSGVNVDDYDIIGVDEGQFFNDLEETVRDWVFNHNKIVIIASLDGDFNLRPFGQVHNLESICEQNNVVRLTAFCQPCLGQKKLVNASFSKRLGSGTAQKDVGGKDKYIPVCLSCYHD